MLDMTYPITAADLSTLREDVRVLRQQSYELEQQVRQLRRDHEAYIAEERDKREHARFIRLMILFVLIAVLNVVASFIPGS
jgi:hypothetical protein